MGKVDLSVGVTAHDEGYLAHKTIRCVLECMQKVVDAGYNFEIVVNIDRGNEITKDYLKRYSTDERFVILNSDFGDLGLSRNNIVKHARGEMMAFIDADDLVSFNWYIDAIKYLEKAGKELILHPARELIFGTDIRPVCCIIGGSQSKASDAMILAGCNRWTSTVLGFRKTFLEHPYMATGNGYGYEDYFFNTEVVADGVLHAIVPDTVMFYRRKRDSLLSRSDADHVIQPYTRLLDIDYLKTLPEPRGAEIFDNIEAKADSKKPEYEPTDFSRKLPRPLQSPYLAIRNNQKINSLVIPVAKTIKKLGHVEDSTMAGASKDSPFRIPEFLISAWRDMNKLEPQLYPSQFVLKHRLEFYNTDGLNRRVGPALWHLAQSIPELPDYIFIVPWLVPGGSEKVMLNYINALGHVHPEWKIAVVTTARAKNTWKSKLGKNAYLVDFGNVASRLDKIEKDFLFSRLITQLKCNRLHVMQSEFGYRWLVGHARLIAANYHVNASVFCNGVVSHPEGEQICGYIDPYLFEAYGLVDNIFTDNRQVIDYIMNLDGYNDAKKFKVHYQPVALPAERTRRSRDGKFRILWASRISKQKQPELLNGIVKILNERHAGEFEIDVYGVLDNEDYKNNPIGQGVSINKKGKYADFSEIPTDDYDMFLYTAKYDGLPNVLLEAAAAGMPIVSSDVGGIGELIEDGKSGILVQKYDSAVEFARAIEYMMKHRNVAEGYGEAVRELVEKRHSETEFKKTVKKDIK